MEPTAEPSAGNQPERLPSRVEPYVRALGEEEAVKFLMRFGGEAVSIPASPQRKSKLTKAIGSTKVEAMLVVFGAGQMKVPQAKRWLAHRLDAAGVSRLDIGRQLRVTADCVRRYFAEPQGGPKA